MDAKNIDIFDVLPNELEVYFSQAAIQMGMGSPIILEKDYWVVKSLKELFCTEQAFSNYVFKGGTSLSKCYGTIQRFSEDIDITISRNYLGFEQELSEIAELGDKKRKRYFEALTKACEAYVATICSSLRGKLLRDPSLGDVYISSEDAQHIIFEYPKSLSSDLYLGGTYVKPRILLEFGCRGELVPSKHVQIETYVEKAYEEIFNDSAVFVNALSAERTFWEKITLLHMLAHKPTGSIVNERMARHYYDVYKLIKSGVAENALKDLSLLDAVSLHKTIFFKSKQAAYDKAKPGTLKLKPEENLLAHIKADYQAMGEMFFGDIVHFDDIITAIVLFQEEFNRMA